MNAEMNTMTVNGVEYVRKLEAQPNGNRAVVVVDRGWIFAGDVTEANGRIKLARAVWVFKWSGVGFMAVVANPGDSADIRKCADVDIPAGAEVFRVPVSENWGL